MYADLERIRRLYPRIAAESDEVVEAHAKTVAEIDSLMTDTNPVHALLAHLPDGKLNECTTNSKRVISFNFHTEVNLLQWLQTREATAQVTCMTFPGYDFLGILPHQHKGTVDNCRSNRKILCILIRSDTTLYCSAGITL